MKLSTKNLVQTSLAVLLLLSPAYTKPVFSQNQLSLMSMQEAAQMRAAKCQHKCVSKPFLQQTQCVEDCLSQGFRANVSLQGFDSDAFNKAVENYTECLLNAVSVEDYNKCEEDYYKAFGIETPIQSLKANLSLQNVDYE